jgi:hypothetical protein
MSEDHAWMKNGWDKSGTHSYEWVIKAMDFVNHAIPFSNINKVRYPCSKFLNLRLFGKNKVALDLCRYGFVPHYDVWVHHNESIVQVIEEEEKDYSIRIDRMDEIIEATKSEFNLDTKDPPTTEVKEPF